MIELTKKKIVIFCISGLLAGFLSGFFGIGGGVVIVPLLIMCGYKQRYANATSLVAILPASIVGTISYLTSGEIHYPTAIILACSIIAGAQIGTKLLEIVPEKVLQWAFFAALAAVGIQQLIADPVRGAEVILTPALGAGLVLVGLVAGTLSGMLGIGGGLIAVPAMTFIFQMSDLTARGTSLLMMIPGTISGTLRNRKNKLADIKVGLIIGLCACITTTFGKLSVEKITPKTAAMFFGIFAFAIIARTIVSALKEKNNPAGPSDQDPQDNN